MFVTAAGLKTHYQQMGKGPLVVLLHGWGCDWQIWSPIISQLSENYRLIIPDLPAFGQSEAPAEAWGSVEYVGWLADFLRQTVNQEPITLVGHSFGGKLAALLAAQSSSLHLTHLVLVDASGLPDPLSVPRQLQKTLTGAIPNFIKQLIPLTIKQRLLTATQSANDHLLASPIQRTIFQRVYRDNISLSLPNIQVPTLVLWGGNDIDTPVHQGRAFAQAIPQATLKVLNRSGHFPFIDQPTEFMRELEKFLNHE